jgi:hypothetical protein
LPADHRCRNNGYSLGRSKTPSLCCLTTAPKTCACAGSRNTTCVPYAWLGAAAAHLLMPLSPCWQRAASSSRSVRSASSCACRLDSCRQRHSSGCREQWQREWETSRRGQPTRCCVQFAAPLPGRAEERST